MDLDNWGEAGQDVDNLQNSPLLMSFSIRILDIKYIFNWKRQNR